MKKKQTACSLFFWILCLIFPLNVLHAQYDPQEWPAISLRFTEGGTLKDVFDAGLRPYRFPALEESLLEAKHIRLTLIQQEGGPLPEFPAERITMHPLQGGLLSSMELTAHKTTLAEARALILPYLSKGGRNTDELDQFLVLVRDNYLDYDDASRGVENFSLRWNDKNGPRFTIAFRRAFDPARPLICFLLIDWSQVRTPIQRRSFHKEPIPPPPGYESESMQAPQRFGPDSQADILLSQGKEINGTFLPLITDIRSPSPANLGGAIPSSNDLARKGPAKTIERKVPLSLWISGIAVLLLGCGRWNAHRRR